MTQKVFLNIAVADLAKSRAFYEALGFAINPQFSGDTSVCVTISDSVNLMVLSKPYFEGFAPKPLADSQASTGFLIALTRETPAEVDAIVAAAVANGGHDNEKVQDMEGHMYGRSFCDPDGHVFEPFWMKPSDA